MRVSLSDLRVLVVDDSSSMRRIVRRFLENGGVKHILEAGHGRSAMEEIKRHPPDLIISDLNMPVMNGMELLTEIRLAPGLRTIPFIILTVEAVQKTMNQALEKGVDAYIVKPVTEKLFIQEVKRVMDPD
ncbi:MAG TPA: response regulator [Desulfobacteraceae bacterium]|nr:response regulator [Desulfobacteraceae bacterium]